MILTQISNFDSKCAVTHVRPSSGVVDCLSAREPAAGMEKEWHPSTRERRDRMAWDWLILAKCGFVCHHGSRYVIVGECHQRKDADEPVDVQLFCSRFA